MPFSFTTMQSISVRMGEDKTLLMSSDGQIVLLSSAESVPQTRREVSLVKKSLRNTEDMASRQMG